METSWSGPRSLSATGGIGEVKQRRDVRLLELTRDNRGELEGDVVQLLMAMV